MENTMNEVKNEVVETVVENAPELPAIAVKDISKNNVVDAVKYLATTCKRTFDVVDSNEAGFRAELDELHNTVASVDDLNRVTDGLKKLTNLCAAGFAVTGIGFLSLGAWHYFNAKKTKPVEVVEPVVLEEDDETVEE